MDTSVRIIKAFLSRWLDNAGTDTNRTLRKLVEFGYYFSSFSPQRQFFSEVRKVISDNSSKYYSLARKLFLSVDRDRISEFGVAFGYYGFDRSSLIRGEKLFVRGKQSPVAGVITSRGDDPDNAGIAARLQRLINGGTNIFFIFDDIPERDENELYQIISRNPRKAFFIFTANNSTALKYDQKNVMTVIDLRSGGCTSLSEQLMERRRLLGAYYVYNDDNADTACSPGLLDEVCDKSCLFLFLKASEGCSQPVREKVGAYGYLQKRRPTHPVFVSDIIGDLEWLNSGMQKNEKQ
ncbi:MAG: hypothetical protein VB064_03955 [Oscillospiraceae bacterium]|nr:hypothetical protein [Oscillospiraceae bacterium]